MSVGNRKVLYINGAEVDTEQDSISVDLGGLEGEATMADNKFGGVSFKTIPGMITAKVIFSASLKKEWWDKNVPFDVEIDIPELGGVATFTGMLSTKTFKLDGKTVELELVGPEGSYT